MNDPVNVAHVASANGSTCQRCGALIGSFLQVEDADAGVPFVQRPWNPGERVVEYEMPTGRSGFALEVIGFCVDCNP